MKRRNFLVSGPAALAGSLVDWRFHTAPADVEAGMVVGASASGKQKVVDPREFSNDSRAIQAVIDTLLEPPSQGTVYLPPARSDGKPLTLPETVHCGNKAPGSNRQTGVSIVQRHPHARLFTTIDDGSERIHTGVQMLEAGQEATVPVERMGDQRRTYRVETYVDPESLSGPAGVDSQILFSPQGEIVQLALRETRGQSAVRVEWYVYRSTLPG